MKKTLIMLLAVMLVLSMAACGTTQEAPSEKPADTVQEPSEAPDEPAKDETNGEPEITITVAHMFADGDPSTIAVEEGKKYIEEKSGVRITFNIYPNGTYGEQNNSAQAVRMGTLDVFCEAFNSNYVPKAGAIQGPFLFEDYEQWDRFKKSDYCKDLVAEIEQAAGYKVMGIGHFGFRELLATQDASTVDALSKMKMRVVNAEPYTQAAVVLGATGTPIGITDVYMSLQTNVVQATENPVSQLVSMKFYEVAKYLVLTDHMIAQQYWIVSNKCYDGLSAEDQALLYETFDFIANRIEEIVEQNEEANIKLMEDNGVTVITPDKQQFRDRLDKVFETYPEWKEIYETIQGI